MSNISEGSPPPVIIRQRPSALTVIILIVFTVICLIPFVNKAFHLDDPLFLWNARQILDHPGDFYGFPVNWYGMEMPMSEVTKNPPVTSYYIAAAAYLFGWSEAALHSALLIPAVFVVLGIYFLAIRFCSQPATAAFAGLLTPVFLVSSTNIMCDTMMLAFWVWAIVFWIDGLEKNNHITLLFSAVLVSICAMTKYFGIALIPLLIIYSLFKQRSLGQWALFMIIPVLVLTGYQLATDALYGRGLLLDAASYASDAQLYQGTKLIGKVLTGLAFSGGGIAVVLFYLPLLWPKKVNLAIIPVTALSILFLPYLEIIGKFPLFYEGEIRWSFIVQFVIFTMAGITILSLAVLDFLKNKDADSMLLFLWIFGTFVFASYFNWTVNARSILPMMPAVAILLMRRIEQRGMFSNGKKAWCTGFPLIPAAILALVVTWADYSLSDTARRAAAEINNSYKSKPVDRWFQGHWGFQYYMESGGGKAYDKNNFQVNDGDIMIIPSNNTNLSPVPEKNTDLLQTITLSPFPWLTTMHYTVGAGFYTDVWGPLPFMISAVPSEKYKIFSIKLSK